MTTDNTTEAAVEKTLKTAAEIQEATTRLTEERIMKWFRHEHLPSELQNISREFYDLAVFVCTIVPPGPERTVAFRSLLLAKDAAVRATVHPGG